MRSMLHSQWCWNGVLAAGGLALAIVAGGPAQAQSNNVSVVSLVLQDFSDCTNGNVNDQNERLAAGRVAVVRNSDGSTSVKVAMTAAPATTYHFFLKCVRQLGDIRTDDEGIGEALFSFATNSTGPVFAFDMYPEGAPSGNKYQSVQVTFQ
jgi:hypothetical protein